MISCGSACVYVTPLISNYIFKKKLFSAFSELIHYTACLGYLRYTIALLWDIMYT